MEPIAFAADLSADILDEMRTRLRATRWPGLVGRDDWRYGVPQGWLQDMVSYWAHEWDWDEQAEEMNQWQHFRVVIDEVPLHYLHASGGPGATPLLLIHGWPWTFWDFKEIIGPLSDPLAHAAPGGEPLEMQAFDVYVVSLPGFGFSVPLTTAGVDVARCAELFVTLMRDVLGHERFAVHGGDWGALIGAHMAHAHADSLIGAHLGLQMVPGPPQTSTDDWAEDEAWKQARNAEAQPLISSHLSVHTLDPQTLAYGLVDSPTATAAWIWERRRNWSDCDGDVEQAFDRDHLCTLAALYWCTGAISSSIRLYHEQFTKPWPLVHDRRPIIEAPTAYAVFPKDVVHAPRAMLARETNLVRYTEMPRGGHFGAPEQPDLMVDDIRAFFGDLTT